MGLVIDKAGTEFIKFFEAFRSKPYRDQAGIWTIGYGHIRNVSENSPAISEEEAFRLLREDLLPPQTAVNKHVTVTLSQNEFNALVSFSFNEGIGKLVSSTLIQKLNRGDRQGAAREFDRWVWYRDPDTQQMKKSDGLVKRRTLEKALFLSVDSIPQVG